ncbi:cyclic 2,3-diphosphoglycerate synthase [Microbaculum marinisediminis]|uniref:Cyclic 2,3-diphosphoglycerate synthase n=1 Tax=Microbaculum marinisediminis TaxID=2931392 RepID=A0AAW5R2Y4_9HYPH|nr:cyclic 2,3-diphosphoglycerate synthase [Microbaculum sp. A6E488]MCT8974567.1 cyclic 2,3-diphosphoglycerate synthase [Microbaculum sp. A6E488]
MRDEGAPRRVVIMGAAGRDFHNFNTVYRGDRSVRVVAFTAAQIPDIAGRRYPAALAGALYPEGIPIIDEAGLAALCREEAIDTVVFAYSDVTHAHVMHQASIALAAGADFTLLGPKHTMLNAQVSVIAVCAVRTGCGKSQVTRWLSRLLKEKGLRVAVVRHPMPYGDIQRQAVQRFETRGDLDAADCTVEEREEYEPHLALGTVVYAGVDYRAILKRAEADADIILWDGGNNDFPFYVPDLMITLVDPMRAGHETAYHPGETVLRMADIVLVAKADAVDAGAIAEVSGTARRLNPDARIVRGASPVTLDDPARVKGRRVLVIEDGPTITHGGMAYGAGYVAAMRAGAEIVDPRAAAAAAPEIAAIYAKYPHIGAVLPAVGYSDDQLDALRRTINAAKVDVVISATPCDLAGLIDVSVPIVRVRYDYAEMDEPGLGDLVEAFLERRERG